MFDFFKMKEKKVTDYPETRENLNKDSREHTKDYYSSFTSISKHIIFSRDNISSYLVGDREEFMDSHYRVDPKYSTSLSYFEKLYRRSYNIAYRNLTKPKAFFQNIEELETLLAENINEYPHKDIFDIRSERRYYQEEITGYIVAFIDRSFKNELRSCASLQTPKGRINHMNHWFEEMQFYKNFYDEKSWNYLQDLYLQWVTKFNAIEEK